MAGNSADETKPLLEEARSSPSAETSDSEAAARKGNVGLQIQNYGLSKGKLRCACGAILLAVMFERLTFYGISSNLVMFLNEEPFSWLASSAASASLIFVGLSYVTSVFGGLIADTLLGRFKTIVLSFILYIMGAILLVLVGYASIDGKFRIGLCGYGNKSSSPKNINHSSAVSGTAGPQDNVEGSMYCGWAVYLSLVIIAIGTGSVKSNLSPFGGDQVRYEGREVMRTFFNWFYWAINVGSLLAFVGVTALQQNVNFFVGFIVPVASLLLAMAVFAVGRTWYLSRRPMGSVLTNTSKIIIQAFKKRKVRKMMFERQDSNELLHSRPTPSFLDMAKVRFGGSFHECMVEDVKSLKTIILVFLGMAPYWLVYFQMQTTFLLQGLHLRFETNQTTAKEKTFQLPPAWLSVFDVIAVLVLLPLFDRLLYPWLDRHGVNFTLLRRMITGMLFSTLAMFAAGILEVIRLKWIKEHPGQTFNQTIGMGNATTMYEAADIWFFWQIPQYILIGISEVFTSVAGLEFAYSMAPRSMQGLIMGIFNLFMGFGALSGSVILHITTMDGIKWFPTSDWGNINNGRLDLYFYTLGGIQFLGMVIFAAMALVHERQEAKHRASTVVINRSNHDTRSEAES